MHNGNIPAGKPSAKPAFTRAHNNQKTAQKAPDGWSIKTKAQLRDLERRQAVPRLEPPGMAQASRGRMQRIRGALQNASMKLKANFMRAKQRVPVAGKAQPTPRGRVVLPIKRQRLTMAFHRARDNRQTTKRPTRTKAPAKGKIYSPRLQPPRRERILPLALQEQRKLHRAKTTPRRGTSEQRDAVKGKAKTAHRQAVRPMVRKPDGPEPVAETRAAQKERLVQQAYARRCLEKASQKMKADHSRSR